MAKGQSDHGKITRGPALIMCQMIEESFQSSGYALELASSLIYVQSNCNVSTSVAAV